MMNYIQQLHHWAKGDLLQAKIMLAWAFIFCLPLICYCFKINKIFYKGLIIPLILLVLMLFGYGSYLLITKDKEVQKLEQQYLENQKEIISKEQSRGNANSQSYVVFKTIWGSLLLVSIVIYLLASSMYIKGFSAGCIILFLTLLITDTLFHARLNVYLSLLQELNK
ncbi:hypothetical protein ACNFU2_03530 [Chryseobacterium sp. PTM-20240506]|uniref:hypothetical protein n=1 Tax=Chryseobacterium sp. PTM-20240506 TaxID=3400631 RepID=UPI003AB0C96E